MNLHLFLPARLNRSGPPPALHSTSADLCSHTDHALPSHGAGFSCVTGSPPLTEAHKDSRNVIYSLLRLVTHTDAEAP